MTAPAHYATATKALSMFNADWENGAIAEHFPIGTGALARVEIGPRLVTLIGGAPGAGKTAFTMQAVVDALRLTPSLKAIVCNVEMPPMELLQRQIARLSGIPLTAIRRRQRLDDTEWRMEGAMATFRPLCERLAFVEPPFDLENVAATFDEFSGGEGGVIVLDYIQRIRPPGKTVDRRMSVDVTMSYLRQFAAAGAGIIVVAAVSRSKDSKGRSSYDADSLGLASFRESSELEFGADDAFLLVPEEMSRVVELRHLKSRYGERCDLALTFDPAIQRFASMTENEDDATLTSAIQQHDISTVKEGENDC